MRKAISIVALLILVIPVLATTPGLKVQATNNSSIFDITYQSPAKDSVKLTIYDHENQIVFTERLSNIASFVRPYSFKGLPYGEYIITVEGKHGLHTERIKYIRNAVQGTGKL